MSKAPQNALTFLCQSQVKVLKRQSKAHAAIDVYARAVRALPHIFAVVRISFRLRT